MLCLDTIQYIEQLLHDNVDHRKLSWRTGTSEYGMVRLNFCIKEILKNCVDIFIASVVYIPTDSWEYQHSFF